jgi:vanillate O-demethylase monooxygenase subunit
LKFELNVWYVGALSTELETGFVARKIAGVPILMFRQESGELAAVSDTCPHRFAPLSRGKIVSDVIQCGYHGMRFNALGKCVHNPQGDVISPNMHIPSYKIVEKYSLIWVWPGNQSAADESLIPDLSEYVTQPGLRMGSHYYYAPYRYDILVDNVLDLSHVPYLHAGSFSSGSGVEAGTTVTKEKDGGVSIVQLRQNSPAPPRDRDLGDMVDEQYTMKWHPGQVMGFEKRTVAVGQPFAQGRWVKFGHVATPCDAKHTHYFMFHTRAHSLDDPAVDAQMSTYQRNVIESEDTPMLKAIQERMEGAELMSLRPVVLPMDKGAMRVRLVMGSRLAAEAAKAGGNDAASVNDSDAPTSA